MRNPLRKLLCQKRVCVRLKRSSCSRNIRLKLRADVVRQLRVGLVNESLILRVPVRSLFNKRVRNGILGQLARIFDVRVKDCFSACWQLQRPVRNIENGGLHIRPDLQLVRRVQSERLHIGRKQHAGAHPGIFIVFIRQR